MAVVTKVNGTAFARGTLYETLQIRAWKVTPTTALTAGLTGTIAALAEEFGSTGALFQAKSDGTSFIIIGDSHALNADTIDKRAENVLAGDSCTVAALTSLYGIT
jgi:monomeric isocitrate dehydrogenase